MAYSEKQKGSAKQTKDFDARGLRFGIVVSEWNEKVCELLYSGAYHALIGSGVDPSHIQRKNVPGAFELSLGAQQMCQEKELHAVICLGCVIEGETKHFDFICEATATGLIHVGLKYDKPVVFGVLTTHSMEQALERAGGKYGNKGEEAALSAIRMLGNDIHQAPAPLS